MSNEYPKILQIAPTPFFSDRGCHIRIEGIVRCLTELGYDNTVCTYHHGRDVDNVITKRIEPITQYTQTSAGPSKYKLLADWRLLKLSIKTYRELKPVAIHAHLHEGLLIGFIVKILFFWHRTPLIGDMQGSLTGELEAHGAFNKKPALRWLTKLVERFTMWAADHIVCSSDHALEKIQSDFDLRMRKISLVQDGADAVSPLNAKKAAYIRNKLRIPADKTVVVYSGALHKSKGLPELKKLILSCRKLSDEMHFLIIGYPKENLSPFLKKMDLRTMCSMTGRIDFNKLPLYLDVADIAIDPKFSDAGEGSGKMLNYMASGLPVVAFNGANNRRFLPHGTPLAETTDQLVEQLKNLHNDKELRAKSAAEHLAKFEENYSWEVTKQQLEGVYIQVFG